MKTMKRIAAILLACMFAMTLLAGCGGSSGGGGGNTPAPAGSGGAAPSGGGEGVIKIGYVSPVTGPLSHFSVGMDNTIKNVEAKMNETGYDIPPMTPFVGENFNLTRAGIHADGMMKNPEIYNIFDTDAILNRPPKVSINNASGLAGVAYWVNEYRAKRGEAELSKKDTLIQKIYDWVTSEYDAGRITVISDGELEDRYNEYAAQ